MKKRILSIDITVVHMLGINLYNYRHEINYQGMQIQRNNVESVNRQTCKIASWHLYPIHTTP